MSQFIRRSKWETRLPEETIYIEALKHREEVPVVIFLCDKHVFNQFSHTCL